MKKRSVGSALACTGAVIGAGFASGREVVVFFTQYGQHAWWLIALSSAVMAGLCALCMNRARSCGCAECWCDLFPGRGAAAQLCSVLLMTITAGAMISAAGHMVSLLWFNEWAYAVGAAGTLWMAWLLSGRSLKPLEASSAVLTLMLVVILMSALLLPKSEMVVTSVQPSGGMLAAAAVRAVSYAALNMTLAIGVVCQSAAHSQTDWRTAGLFGWLIAVLLLVSNSLYSRHPQLVRREFPLVQLLQSFGRAGYIGGAGLLYLSVFTTLAAIMVGIRSAARTYLTSRWLQMGLCIGLPVLVSCVGFSGIVESIYAPAGLVCLAAVFVPLLRKKSLSK